MKPYKVKRNHYGDGYKYVDKNCPNYQGWWCSTSDYLHCWDCKSRDKKKRKQK